jgi:hypothetical protein
VNRDDNDRSDTQHPGTRAVRRAPEMDFRLIDPGTNDNVRYPCPRCGAKRYEHCFVSRQLRDPDTGDYTGEWYFIHKPEPCSGRPRPDHRGEKP